jgi:hypothetical protein
VRIPRSPVIRAATALAGAGVAVALAIGLPVQTSPVAEPLTLPVKNRPAPAKARSAETLDLARLHRAPPGELEDNLFKLSRVQPPEMVYVPPPLPARPAPPSAPPPLVSPPPQPAPSAPPLPFRFVGMMIDHGTPILFVAQGRESYVLRAGQTVNEVYRLEQLAEHEATFVYIPLNQRQTLSIARAR